MPKSKRHPKRRKIIAGRQSSGDYARLMNRWGVPSARCWACGEPAAPRDDELAVCSSCIFNYKFSCDDCGQDVINIAGEIVHL